MELEYEARRFDARANKIAKNPFLIEISDHEKKDSKFKKATALKTKPKGKKVVIKESL